MGDYGLAVSRFLVAVAVVSAVVGVVLWHVVAWLLRHVRVEWVA